MHSRRESRPVRNPFDALTGNTLFSSACADGRGCAGVRLLPCQDRGPRDAHAKCV